MEILIFVLGIIAGLIIERIALAAWTSATDLWRRYRWQRVNRSWDTYKDIVADFDVIQRGWQGLEFRQSDVVIPIERDFDIDNEFKAVLLRYEAEWYAKNLKNNVQIGLFEVDPHRTSDSPGEPSHCLFLRGQRIKFFEFLATNRLLISQNSHDRDPATRVAGEANYLKPITVFANPLSVGLSLLCENGRCLVLTRRTQLISSGGTWGAGLKFNAVGETVNPRDVIAGLCPGFETVSPWNTARRALSEELGLSDSDLEKSSLVLHSLVFDRRIRDYKFFGYSIIGLSRSEVEKRWLNAPDKSEAKEIFFQDCASGTQCRKIVDDICKDRANWTTEGVFCTLWTFFHLGRLSPEEAFK